MTTYIDKDYIYGAPPPYTCENAAMYLFVIEGDQAKIQAYLDLCLNLPANNIRHYTAISRFMMVSFVHIEKVRTGGAYLNKGYAPETEVTFWILTLGMSNGLLGWHIDLLPPHPAFFAPFLFINTMPPLVGGREIFGFNKQWGEITMPKQPSDPACFSVDVFGFKEYGYDVEASTHRLLTISRTDADSLTMPTNDAWTKPGALLHAAAKELGVHQTPLKQGGEALAEDFFLNLFDVSVPEVFLKELRDIADPSKAAYQAITEASSRITRMTSGLLDGDFAIDLEALASMPIGELFGLPQQMRSLFSMWVNVDMTIQPGNVVWEA
jgi:hypothetical protein